MQVVNLICQKETYVYLKFFLSVRLIVYSQQILLDGINNESEAERFKLPNFMTVLELEFLI
jgi:hypothetical protein